MSLENVILSLLSRENGVFVSTVDLLSSVQKTLPDIDRKELNSVLYSMQKSHNLTKEQEANGAKPRWSLPAVDKTRRLTEIDATIKLLQEERKLYM